MSLINKGGSSEFLLRFISFEQVFDCKPRAKSILVQRREKSNLTDSIELYPSSCSLEEIQMNLHCLPNYLPQRLYLSEMYLVWFMCIFLAGVEIYLLKYYENWNVQKSCSSLIVLISFHSCRFEWFHIWNIENFPLGILTLDPKSKRPIIIIINNINLQFL